MIVIESFGDELIKLAQEIPLPKFTETGAHRAAAKKYGPVDVQPKAPYKGPKTMRAGKNPMLHAEFAFNPAGGSKKGSKAWHDKEEAANPWMRDKAKWLKYHAKRRRGSAAVEYGSDDKQFRAYQGALDKRRGGAKSPRAFRLRVRDRLRQAGGRGAQ